MLFFCAFNKWIPMANKCEKSAHRQQKGNKNNSKTIIISGAHAFPHRQIRKNQTNEREKNFHKNLFRIRCENQKQFPYILIFYFFCCCCCCRCVVFVARSLVCCVICFAITVIYWDFFRYVFIFFFVFSVILQQTYKIVPLKSRNFLPFFFVFCSNEFLFLALFWFACTNERNNASSKSISM